MPMRAILWLLCLFMVCEVCAGEDASDPDALWQALLEAPPATPPTTAREAALKALDEWIGQPNSEHGEACVAYYRRAVNHALDLLEKERPERGMRIFQLYSSSVIVQTPSAVIGIDLDQGPNENLRQTPQEEGTPFCMTDEQVARLADLVDYAFHTHEHGDHMDCQIVKALLDRGKTVIGTEGIRALWADEPWAEAILTPPQTMGKGWKVGDLQVNVLWDRQWSDETHEEGTQNNAYLIALPEDLTVFVKGDVNCGLRLLGWLHLLAEQGCVMDVMVGSAIYWRGPNVAKQIDALHGPLLLPGHTWEFGHRRAGEARGNAMGFWQAYMMVRAAAKRGGAVSLSWGEFIDIPKRQSD